MKFFFFSLLVYFFLVKEGVVIQALNYGDKEKIFKKSRRGKEEGRKGKERKKKKRRSKKISAW